jgi:hypothetical protein
MAATISGNVGGSSFSGVIVSLYGQSSNGPVQTTATSDSSGNYSFAGLVAGNYVLQAQQVTVSSLLYKYYTGHGVSVQSSDVTGNTTFAGVNFAPTAANATNTPTF